MKGRSFASEAELGPPVLAWFAQRGYDLYQEVVLGSGGGAASADIVGVKGALLAVVELKRAFTFDVIAQAVERRWYAHHVYVAVPAAKPSDGRRLAERVCAYHGIGVLYVPGEHDAWRGVDLKVAPAVNRRAEAARLRAMLHERQKTFAAAGTQGSRWTGFKATVEKVQRGVAASPGITLKALVDSFDHHYANDKSARQHLAGWIDAGKIDGVRMEREGRTLKLYPAAKGASL